MIGYLFVINAQNEDFSRIRFNFRTGWTFATLQTARTSTPYDSCWFSGVDASSFRSMTLVDAYSSAGVSAGSVIRVYGLKK